MVQSFRILLVEDNQDDVELLRIQLKKLDLEFYLDIVDKKETFRSYFERQLPDLIISDYNLPDFTGTDALDYVRKTDKNLPFILVSGYIGQEKAVDAMRMGASDYVLKDNLERLVPAIERELLSFRKHKKIQQERDKAIRDHEERIKEQRCLYNISRLDDQKLSIKDLLKNAANLIPAGWKYPEITRASIEYAGETFQTPNYSETEWHLTEVTGLSQNRLLKITVVYLEEKPKMDIGPFIREEQHLIESIADILTLKINRILDQKELERKQEQLEKTYDLAQIGNWELDVMTYEFDWSHKTREIHEMPKDSTPTQEKLEELYKKSKDWPAIEQSIDRITRNGEAFDHEVQIVTAKGNERWVRVMGHPEFEDGKVVKIYGSIQNIDKRKRAEEQLLKSEQRFRSLVQDGLDMIAIIDENGNYKYVAPTRQRKNEMGMQPEEFIGKNAFDLFHEDDKERLLKNLKSLKPNESLDVEPFRYKGKEGQWKWMESTITNLSENPAIGGYVTNSRDVTERIEREKKLREIVEHSTNLFFKHDVNHQLEYISPQSYDLVGLEPEEAMLKWTDLLTDHPKNEIGFKKTMKAIETGKPQDSYELQFKHANGTTVWARVHEAPVVENGETVAIVGSLTDITAQKEYEEKLEHLSLVAAKTTDLIIMTDADDQITWVNKAFEEHMGYRLDECIGKNPNALLRGKGTDKRTAKKINNAKKENRSIQETILNYKKNGSPIWLAVTADPIFDDDGNFKGYIAIDRDVTEQIKQKRKLQESLERYEIVTKATSDIIWDADLQNGTVEYNSNICEVLGYTESEIENTGEWWLSKIHPDDRKYIDNQFKLAELSKTDHVQTEYRFQCADGSYKYVNDRAHIIADEQGNPVRMIGAMQDITKQKEENMWLKLLESAITNTNEPIAILNGNTETSPHREILFVNDAFEKMTGYKKDEILGRSLLQLMGDETSPRSIVKVLQSLDRGEVCQVESAYYSKTGKELWAQISFAPVRDSDGEFSHWICIGRDITDRREKEKELHESLHEKETLLMEIHHRVKNNLAVVSSMMLLQAMDEEDESVKRKLYDSVARIRTMVTIHELLYEAGSFSKLDFSVNLKRLVSMIIDTIQNQQNINVEYNCDAVELNVNQAIPSSLIVNEIITNCIKHAFTGKKSGHISVSLEENYNHIQITITDNGIGLPGTFESPGETTLGLRLIDILSQQIGATYTYKSKGSEGTEFSIHFEKAQLKGIGNAHLI